MISLKPIFSKRILVQESSAAQPDSGAQENDEIPLIEIVDSG